MNLKPLRFVLLVVLPGVAGCGNPFEEVGEDITASLAIFSGPCSAEEEGRRLCAPCWDKENTEQLVYVGGFDTYGCDTGSAVWECMRESEHLYYWNFSIDCLNHCEYGRCVAPEDGEEEGDGK